MRSKYERKAQKILEEDGYLVDFKIRPSSFRVPRGYMVDFFGLFDLCAYKLNNPLRWISIKGRAGIPSTHRQAIEAFKIPLGNIKEIWSFSKKRVKQEIID